MSGGILAALEAALTGPAPAGGPSGDVLADLAAVLGEDLVRPARAAPEPPPPPAAPMPDLRAMMAERAAAQAVRPGPPLRALVEAQAAADPERMPWPAGWWARCDPGEAQAMRRMWGDALLAALQHMLAGEPARDGGQRRFDEGWLGTRDFREVCELAGFDGPAVAERVRRLVAEPGGRAALEEALSPGIGVRRRNVAAQYGGTARAGGRA